MGALDSVSAWAFGESGDFGGEEKSDEVLRSPSRSRGTSDIIDALQRIHRSQSL